MDILGLGTDIMESSRLEKVLARHADAFRQRVFTPRELDEAAAKKLAGTEYLSGRWAAKEAMAKALGCGIGANCSFTDIEVVNNALGAPEIVLSGSALATFTRLGGKKINISISHEKHYAVATVIITG